MTFKHLTQALLLVVLVLSPITTFAATDTLAKTPREICPLPIGSALPELPTRTLDGKPFDLSAALQAKPTILIYFRGGW